MNGATPNLLANELEASTKRFALQVSAQRPSTIKAAETRNGISPYSITYLSFCEESSGFLFSAILPKINIATVVKTATAIIIITLTVI
jgi:hypothetical protein